MSELHMSDDQIATIFDNDLGERFESIINQSHYAEVVLVNERGTRRALWVCQFGPLAEHALLEDGTARKSALTKTAVFTDFASAMQRIAEWSVECVTRCKGYDRV